MEVSITYYIINDIRKFCLRKDKLYVLKMFCSSEKEENFHCIYNSEKNYFITRTIKEFDYW